MPEPTQDAVQDALKACDELASYEDTLHEDGFRLFPAVMMRCIETIRSALRPTESTPPAYVQPNVLAWLESVVEERRDDAEKLRLDDDFKYPEADKAQAEAEYALEALNALSPPTEPTPEQGRVETREEWRNVYPARAGGDEFTDGPFKTRKEADDEADYWSQKCPADKRITVEKITIHERTERIDLGGEQDG